MTVPTSKPTSHNLNGITGYSSIPSVYDDYVAKAEADSVFGKQYVNPSYTPPIGSECMETVCTHTAWGGTIGLIPDPKLNKPKHQEDFSKHTMKHPEDWRAKTDKIPPGAAQSIAMKFDSGKTDWSLMPFEAIEEINKVLDFGARKYAAHNWKTGTGFRYTRVLSSLLRHTFAWARGEDLDPESGLSHLSHMGCNVIFLIYYNKHKSRYNNDDRAAT